MIDIERRRLLTSLGAAAVAGPAGGVPRAARASGIAGNDRGSIFDPRQYGAKGDGKALDSGAINGAIDACAVAGGGMVYVAPGIYRSGTVLLKSNVTLYLEAGATIQGSTSMDDYKLPSGEGKHLIVARDAENVTLCGPGRIDGQGPSFWKRSEKTPLPKEEGWADVLTRYWMPNGGRPSPMIEFANCKWVRVEDVRVENAPCWTMRAANCEQVFIRGVAVKNPTNGPNTDGIDISGCANVFISDCSINTGDDAICLKAENPYGGQPLLTRNVVVTNCVLTTCCNGFKLGTTSEGGFENITFSNSVIYNDPVELGSRVIAGIALEVVDGGWIDGVVVTGIRMQRARTPIFIRLGDRAKKFNNAQRGLRGVTIENLHASESILASSITGLENMPVEDVTLSNIRIDSVVAGKSDWADRPVPEIPEKYPESRMFGMLPSYGLYCRHVRGLRLADVAFRAPTTEQRPVLICDDVRGTRVSGLSSAPTQGSQPAVKLLRSKDVWITQSAAPTDMNTWLGIEGKETASVLVSGCDLRGVNQAVHTAGDVPTGAVTASGNVTREG